MAVEYFIQKKGYVGNSLIWWKIGGQGYTTDISQAERFTEKDALKIIESANSDKVAHPVGTMLRVAELHINVESKAFNDYQNKVNQILTNKS